MEVWKDIQGNEGKYQISNEGRVKSLKRLYVHEDRILGTKCDKDGYYIVKLSNKGLNNFCGVHKLVAEAFIPNPDPTKYTIVHHIDHNPRNNKVENLMWMTKQEHQAHHIQEALGKTVYQYTLDGKLVAIWPSTIEAARELGFSDGNICQCCNGKRNKHKGYIWSYLPIEDGIIYKTK